MLSRDQVKAVQQRLDEVTRRLYFFDNDVDGLASFLLLNSQWPAIDFQCLLSGPSDEELYFTKLQETGFQLAVILDRPMVSERVIQALEQVLWIDHHPPVTAYGAQYVNPRKENGNIPTACLAQALLPNTNPQTLLLSALGAAWDYYLPSHFTKLREQFPSLIDTNSTNLDIIHFDSQFGYLLRLLTFLLTGKKSEIHSNIERLRRIEDIRTVFTDTSLQQHYQEKERKYEQLITQAQEEALAMNDALLVFTYAAHDSYTGYLANHLRYLFGKTVVVAKTFPDSNRYTMSIRATDDIDLHTVLPKAFDGLRGDYGGHEHACGAHIAKAEFDTCINRLQELLQ